MSTKLTQESRIKSATLSLAIAATFTAEPIERTLTFWMNELGFTSELQFAPYNQVFQQLLEPTSLLQRNKSNQNVLPINILLLRLEDWIGSGEISGNETYLQLEATIADFIDAFISANNQSVTPTIVCVVPARPTSLAIANFRETHRRIEKKLALDFASVPTTQLLLSSDILSAETQSTYYDDATDKSGHVPYTESGFVLLGTAIARKIAALRSTPHKVIVLDCDNTLWQGVCGEDGSDGIQISRPFINLQQFMLTQKEEGMLLCLCSKNREQDALDVFRTRSDMQIKLDDLVTWRINWKAKSQNIQSLAQELQLGLDSFIFIDDNPVECAEVEANCPQVTTLLLPKNADEFSVFLQNSWVFDRLKITAEDRKRTQLYQQNVERERFRNEVTTLNTFLDALNLQITFLDLAVDHLPRVSQMTQRTNQFNFTTIRRSEAELQTLCLNGPATCWVVDVSDRFGDYGIVSTVIFEIKDQILWIDTMLLSCRSLGRGVERRIFTKLAEHARANGASYINAKFTATARNQPALNFLENIHADNANGRKISSEKISNQSESIYTFPVEYLLSLSTFDIEYENHSEAVATAAANKKIVSTTKQVDQSKSALHNRIAKELNSSDKILALLHAQTSTRPELQEPFVAPQTIAEQSIADIWCNVLRLDQVGINDSFADLGGSSLQVVQVHSKVRRIFDADLPITQLFGLPTIHALANYINQNSGSNSTVAATTKTNRIQDRASRQKQAMARQKPIRIKR